MDVFQPSLLPPVSTEPQFTDELESALSEYESRLQNTRDGNAAIKNWRMGNYRAVSEIMQRNPNIGIRLDGRLTLMGSQAADYILNSNGFRDAIDARLGYPRQGHALGLSGKELKKWEEEKAKLVILLEDKESACYKFLKKVGFSPGKILKNLENQVPYSTESTNDATIERKFYDLATNNTVKDSFMSEPLVDASTGYSGKIYYRPSGINLTTILHENIHSTFKGKEKWTVYDPIPNSKNPTMVKIVGRSPITDEELQRKLGIAEQYNTTNINSKLADEGCK